MRRRVSRLISRTAWPLLQRRGEATAWHERWDAPPTPPAAIDLWLHTPSLGELAPLAAWVARAAATRRVGITVTSGRSLAAVRQRFGAHASVHPLPLPASPRMAAWLEAWRPARLILLEADAWPELLLGAVDGGAEVAVLGGRLGTVATPIWRRFAAQPARLARLVGIWARDEHAAAAYRNAGLPAAKIHGDYVAKLAHAQAIAPEAALTALERPLIVAGSLHPQEAPLVARAAVRLAARHPELRWAVVPRHPERTAALAAAFTAAGLATATWPAQAQVTLIPRYGVLAGLYGLAAAAVIGGAWVRRGGHNPVEAVVHSVPAVIGPHHRNQAALLATLPPGAVTTVAASATALEAALAAALAIPAAQRATWPAALAARAARVVAATDQAFAT